MELINVGERCVQLRLHLDAVRERCRSKAGFWDLGDIRKQCRREALFVTYSKCFGEYFWGEEVWETGKHFRALLFF